MKNSKKERMLKIMIAVGTNAFRYKKFTSFRGAKVYRTLIETARSVAIEEGNSSFITSMEEAWNYGYTDEMLRNQF